MTTMPDIMGGLLGATAQPQQQGRTYVPYTGNPYTYGQGGEHQFFANNSLSKLSPQAAPSAATQADAMQALLAMLTAPGSRNAWQGNGGAGGNFGIGGLSNASSLGGFLSSTLGNMAAVTSPLGLFGVGYGIANNNPSLGLFSAISDALGWGGGSGGDAGWGGGGNGMAGDPGSGTGDPGSAYG
ncbi:hypothetical protein E6C67_26730 [Azospirillum sp. TSA2s]|uniref:hypothetical protein n=1 Tax=Azospirillum sp. TSA2s TaxID=709810 RepID=UPI0010AAA24D|nr:hypothetical protein [Azospirillum sp. TSA2s]QCG97371.1 hypothetical protein E6C67_26730 [Azospirillum sp. TSA2s]